MKKIFLILIVTLFSSSIFASDDKPGRFFKDQPDVNDDYQIHFIYLLAKKTKDKEFFHTPLITIFVPSELSSLICFIGLYSSELYHSKAFS